MIMGSVTDYVLVEPTNMQQVKDRQNHKSLLPRLVRTTNGEEYSSTFYLDAAISEEKVNDGYLIRANTGLSDKNGKELVGINPQIEYALTENGLDVKVIRADGLKFVLPLIAGEVKVQSGKIEGSKEVFFLTGGFIAQEYTILPDESGNIRVSVEA